jgi:glutathionyl-hydroquinone reductase
MPSLIEGKLADTPVATNSESGEFKRADSSFRGQIHPSEARAGRYHLYLSYACPWAHRTLIVRQLKQLEGLISVSVTDPFMGNKGWSFNGDHRPQHLYQVYQAADSRYTGKITVPVLWDVEPKTIVNNESAEIIRIFNTAFDQLTGCGIDLYPEEFQSEIDRVNDRVYHRVNNGVYKAGFATSQRVYERECRELFETLDELEDLLRERPFLAGEYLTEADVRLFTTLLRFDPVYYGHFKCNLRRIADYHHLFNYLKCLYQIPGFKKTCHLDHIKTHYYASHDFINPTRIVPLGPVLDLDASHDRGEVRYYFKRGHH